MRRLKEPETEIDEEKSQDDSAVTLSSISRHQVPVVAVKEDAELIETEEVSRLKLRKKQKRRPRQRPRKLRLKKPRRKLQLLLKRDNGR